MLFYYLLHISLPPESDDRDVAQNEFLFHNFSFLYHTGVLVSPFYNIFIVKPRPFSAFIATYTPLSYLTRQTDRYLRGLYSSSRTQLLSTPRFNSHFFFTSHIGVHSFDPPHRAQRVPYQKWKRSLGFFHTRVIGFSFFGFPGYCWA